MPKIASFASISGIKLDRQSDMPLFQQLYLEIRSLILQGDLASGCRLPSTRNLCEELNLSRSTVVEGIAQLVAEGYVIGQVGRGTFVCETLPDRHVTPYQLPNSIKRSPGEAASPPLSDRGRGFRLNGPKALNTPLLLQPGIPDTTQFPLSIWRKLINQSWKNHPQESIVYGPAAGYPPLREAIADHVRTTRRVKCTADQVILTSGSQQALFIAAQLVLDPGDPVWIENPGYRSARAAFRSAGGDLIPIPVDGEGMQVEYGIERERPARAVYVCPSHQYPVGGTLSLTRRMQLLNWAAEQNAWVIEDDYDSEFRYVGHPLASLQSLDEGNRIIYIGTFSKVLFPGLRIGYAIVPASIAAEFASAKSHIDRGSPQVTQIALSQFMREGHLNRHIRKMRVRYAHRQSVVIESIRGMCGDLLEVSPSPAGIHLLARLRADLDDRSISERLYLNRFGAPPLSDYSLTELDRGGLVLGYAAHDEGTLRAAIKRMAQLLVRS